MAKTVVGLMDSFNEAENVVDDLVRNGFDRDNIGLVAQDEGEKYPSERAKERGGGREAEGAMKGAGAGAAIGGVAGLVMGITGLAIPGIGPIIAAGPIAATLAGAGVGAVAGGLIGGLTNLGVPEEHAHYYAEGVRRGGILVTVACEDARAADAASIMRRHGAVDIEKRAAEWKESGWSGREGVIPTVEEEVRVGKRQVDTGGVRVKSRVTEQPVEEDITLREERAKVERRPVDRPLSASESEKAFRETSIDIPEMTEEPVVSKQARVKEEVVVGREEKERTARIRETARRTDVDVQAGGRHGVMRDEGFLEPDDEDFQRHFQSYYAQRGENYPGFKSAYIFGARRSQTSDKDWPEIEEDLHRDWDKDHPGTWSKYKEAIHYGWEKEARRH
jgi:uncharacterized protein (TIGR02271 family)